MAEYKFPDEENNESDVNIDIDSEGDIELEVVDDTPEPDRGRKSLDKEPDEVTDEEVATYSDKVQKRIKELAHSKHDERRAKEAALREKEEAVKFAQQVFEENKKLRAGLADNQTQNVELIKAKAGSELDIARRKYKEAQESMDPDQILEAQEALTEAKIRLNQIESYRPPPLQEKEDTVYTESVPQNVTAPDEKATRWQAQNPWFGEDDEMTSLALGVHRKLVSAGIDPRTDVYYERLNARIKEIFPDKFGGSSRNDKKPANVVAPATRTTGAKKVRLTQTQVAFAKRLGVPLQDYAREVAKQMGKDNG
jgi:hypothetical protein